MSNLSTKSLQSLRCGIGPHSEHDPLCPLKGFKKENSNTVHNSRFLEVNLFDQVASSKSWAKIGVKLLQHNLNLTPQRPVQT